MTTGKSEFYSPGKLLISGEYLIICGAKGLALPTQSGQTMTVSREEGPNRILWQAFLNDGSLWFEATFEYPQWKCLHSSDHKKAEMLLRILPAAGHKVASGGSYTIQTKLDFDPAYGLGSSSTFLSNFAQWAEINPFDLLPLSFGGSGYDLAVAMQKKALIFSRDNHTPKWQEVHFKPAFSDELLFVYSGQKRVSKDAIKNFNCHEIPEHRIHLINEITAGILHCSDLNTFETFLDAHEICMSEILQVPTLKSAHFQDFPGAVKSLGAWGGDFFLATRKSIAKNYFSNKGYTIMFEWNELIKD